MEIALIVFPVRFVAEGSAVETTSRALSCEEISVRCLQPPRLDARVSMALYLPGAGRPEVAVGQVCEACAEPLRPADAGFRARFLALDPEGRHRIEVLLEELERSGPPPERATEEIQTNTLRLYPRVPVRFKVRFEEPLDFVTQYAENIARGGLFIETLDPPEIGRSVSAVLWLPDGGPPVSAATLVVHRVTLEDAQRTGETPGCGVQFLDTSDGFHARIDDCLAMLAGEIAPA